MKSVNFAISGRDGSSIFTTENGYGTWEPHMAKTLLNTASEESVKSGGWNRRLFENKVSLQDREVLIIKAEVPSFGTYAVNVRIKADAAPLEGITLFAGRRNMIDRDVNVDVDSVYEREFYTAVTPYIPTLSSERCNDTAVFVSLTGKDLMRTRGETGRALLREDVTVEISIIEKEVPVIWIAGDSTVADQNTGIPYFPKDSCGGWAQMLSLFIKDAAVCNMAHSGLTTRCFQEDGHYDIVNEFIKPGDIFIIQFGHNDQKRRNLAASKGYSAYLRKYVNEIRNKGAEAVICSPISRVPLYLDGEKRHYSLLLAYAEAARNISDEMETAFADLHGRTFDKWIELGEKCRDFFIPGDITHTNDNGAQLVAGYFMEEMRKEQSSPIIPYDNGRTAGFDTVNMDTARAPKEITVSDALSIELPYVDIPKIKDCIFINEALKYGILDPCVMHLHPDDEMPRGQFLMTMFKAFRLGPTRPYTGKYVDLAFDEWDSGFVQTLIDENLIDDITIKKVGKDRYFRPDDALSYGEYASFIIRFMEQNKDARNISMEDCLKKAYELDIIGDICKGNENDYDFYYEEDDNEYYRIAGCPYISRAKAYRGLARLMDIMGGIGTALPADLEVHPAR